MPIHETDDGWVLETQSTGHALGLNQAGPTCQSRRRFRRCVCRASSLKRNTSWTALRVRR